MLLSKGSFEDYLYILIGLVWVAFSLYKGNKSKKHSTSRVRKVKDDKGLLETLYNEFTREEQPQKDIPNMADSIVADTLAPSGMQSLEQKVFSDDDIFQQSNSSKTENAEVTAKTQVDLEKEPKLMHKQISRQRFDLKKAIIYSEILQPKYF